jgi:hypothetical protein
MGNGPGRAALRLRRVVAPQRRRRHHVGVGDAVDARGRAEPRGPPGQAVRPSPRLLEPVRRQADPAHRLGRRASDGARAEAGSQSAQALGLRRGRHQRRRSVGLGVVVAPRWRPVGGQEGDNHPRRARGRLPAPARACALRGRPAAGERHRPVGRRPLAVRVVLGNRGAQALRRKRSAQPERGGLGAPRRDRRPNPAPGRPPSCDWPARPRWSR